MKEKLVILWVSKDVESAVNMAFMYARNSKLQGWWDEVDLVIWGPSALLSVENEVIRQEFELMRHVGVNIKACIACAQRYGVVDRLKEQGIEVLPMGPVLTDELKSQTRIITI